MTNHLAAHIRNHITAQEEAELNSPLLAKLRSEVERMESEMTKNTVALAKTIREAAFTAEMESCWKTCWRPGVSGPIKKEDGEDWPWIEARNKKTKEEIEALEKYFDDPFAY